MDTYKHDTVDRGRCRFTELQRDFDYFDDRRYLCTPQITYMIGEDVLEGTGYEDLLLEKDESAGTFSNTGGHSVTYVQDDSLNAGEYYLYLFNNNFGVSKSKPAYDWEQIEGIETSMKEGRGILLL